MTKSRGSLKPRSQWQAWEFDMLRLHYPNKLEEGGSLRVLRCGCFPVAGFNGDDVRVRRLTFRGAGMRRVLLVAVGVCLMAGCAATYNAPTATAPETSRAIRGSADSLMRAAKQTLVVEGFQITNADDAAKVISTAPRDVRLTPDQADCGTTMGIDYLKDNRTSATVAYGVLVSENRVLIKATIAAKYLPASVSQSITMSCVSRGVLEALLLAKIQAAAI